MPLLRCMDRILVAETFPSTRLSRRWVQMILAMATAAATGVTPPVLGEAIAAVATATATATVLHLWAGALIASSVGDLDIGLENALLPVTAVLAVDYLLALGLEAVEVEGVGTALEVETATATAMWMIGMMEGVMGIGTVLRVGTLVGTEAAVGVIVMEVTVMGAIGMHHRVVIATMEAAVEATGLEGVLTVTLRMDTERKEAMIGMVVQGGAAAAAAVIGTEVVGPCVMRGAAAADTGRDRHRMIVLAGEGALHLMIADN